MRFARWLSGGESDIDWCAPSSEANKFCTALINAPSSNIPSLHSMNVLSPRKVSHSLHNICSPRKSSPVKMIKLSKNQSLSSVKSITTPHKYNKSTKKTPIKVLPQTRLHKYQQSSKFTTPPRNQSLIASNSRLQSRADRYILHTLICAHSNPTNNTYTKRFISNRSLHAVRDRYHISSPEAMPDTFSYLDLLRNEILNTHQSEQRFDYSALQMNALYEINDDAKDDETNKFSMDCHFGKNHQNSKYFEFNKGASPINEKDKLSKTPSNSPTNDNTNCCTTNNHKSVHSPKRFLNFCNDENNAYYPMPSTTPIRTETQLKISSLRYDENSNDRGSNGNDNAYKILDAPSIMDDFYSSVLDWNAYSKLIGVALKDQLFAYNPTNQKIVNLVDTTGGKNKSYFGETFSVYTKPLITSVKFIPSGSHISVGTDCGVLSLWDVERAHCVLHIDHNDNHLHIGTADWKDEHCIIYGSKLKNNINMADLRQCQSKPSQVICTPTKSVSIKWSPDYTKFAIGGRDRCVSIYDARYLKARVFKLKYHTSSIRAIEWSPHNFNVLMSGGGALDKKICLWNLNVVNGLKASNNYIDYNCITVNRPIKCIRTQSQVCDIIWNPFRANEILSTHGFDTNDINLWNVESGEVVTTLKGHKERVLYVSKSPNDCDIVTGSNDETLRFWNVFRENKKMKQRGERFNDDVCERFNIR